MRTKLCLLPTISGVEVAPSLLPKISGVEVTPSITSVESSEQFWRKIRQIWRICEPWMSSSEKCLFGLIFSWNWLEKDLCSLPGVFSHGAVGGRGWLNYGKDVSRFILLYGLYINIIFSLSLSSSLSLLSLFVICYFVKFIRVFSWKLWTELFNDL